jgi:hypothetical protein
MPQAGTILSPSRRVTVSYDEEMAIPPAQLAALAERERIEETIDNETQDAIDEAYVKAYMAAEKSRWAGQERWQGKENEEMRFVNILHPHAIFRKLRKAGVDARIEAPSFWVWQMGSDGKPEAIKRERSNGRLWLHDDAINGRIGVSAWVWENGVRVRKMVTTLQYPYGPEWSLMRFNEWNVPTNERYRGWRTALMQLIKQEVLTEREVNRAFGAPLLNDASYLYRKSLYDYRMKRAGLIQ